MNNITYHHDQNSHSRLGAAKALDYMIADRSIKSLLDVGAGTGNWLLAAQMAGIEEVRGVDGVMAPGEILCVEPELIHKTDLLLPLNLGRKFDAVLCLEVAEHLPMEASSVLILSLCRHSDLIFFSAAAPGQRGERHINCRPPVFWQGLFNFEGFVCEDTLRPLFWDVKDIEPWYRQNTFVARRDESVAGSEPRVRYLIHPDMTEHTDFLDTPMSRQLLCMERGVLHPLHYLDLFSRSVTRRLWRIGSGRWP